MKLFVYSVIFVVTASIIAGFFVIGSPQTERFRRIDEQRIADLQTIQWQLVSFWQSKGFLPDSLEELKDSISGFTPPNDPETGDDYEYVKNEEVSFQLCADFYLVSDSEPSDFPRAPNPVDGSENWTHLDGRHCFERTIDPERYPQFEKAVPVR